MDRSVRSLSRPSRSPSKGEAPARDADLIDALRQLPGEYREILLGILGDGKSTDLVAIEMGLDERLVGLKYLSALSQLQLQLHRKVINRSH